VKDGVVFYLITSTSLSLYINEQCGVSRTPDGLLADDVGLVPGARELCQKFIQENLTKEEKSEIKKQLSTLSGTEFYMTIIIK